MQNIQFASERFRPKVAVMVAVLLVGAFIQAQEPASPELSADAAFLVRAAKSHGIVESSLKPWHLRVSFQLYDHQGIERDHGTYEELSQNRFVYKRIYRSGVFNQVQYGNAGGAMATGDLRFPPPFFNVLRTAIVTPTISESRAEQIAAHPEIWSITSEYRSVNGSSLHCYDIIRATRFPPPETTTYCFNDQDVLVQYTVGEASLPKATVTNPISYQDRTLPGDLVIEQNGVRLLTAHVESIETIDAADDVFSAPPADAQPLQPTLTGGVAAKIEPPPTISEPPATSYAVPKLVNISAGVAVGMLLHRTPPVYPPEARAAYVAGTVVLQATISTEGAVENLVISGPAMLQQAALDAIRTWRYRPYLLNGQPVAVNTTINIIFTLPKPPPSEQEPE